MGCGLPKVQKHWYNQTKLVYLSTKYVVVEAATDLVVEFNGTGDGLGKGESGGLGDNAAELVPFLLGNVLGGQAVG